MLLNSLDEVPWSTLDHAYGKADDVPGLIRALQSSETSSDALHELFGNIWHQGTVYQATSFAVPFLVELTVNESTPNRVGILNLLEAISHGTSYLDVHEPLFREMKVEAFGDPGTPKYENARSQELVWVEKSRTAVLSAFDHFVNLTKRTDDVAYAALAVLVRLNIRKQLVSTIIHKLRSSETRDLYRAGVLLLLGQMQITKVQIWITLSESAQFGARLERLAAGLVACRFESGELPGSLRDAVIDAMCICDVEWLFAKLPWDAVDCVDTDLLSQRPKSELDFAITTLFNRIERDDSVRESIHLLLGLLFPRANRGGMFTAKDQFTTDQLRLLFVLLDQFDNHRLHLNVSLMQYGLPESRRNLRCMITGVAYTKPDDLYPEIGFAENPLRPRRIGRLKTGDRIHSRYFD
ncbi:MAG: hypothetical protein U0930_10735 [Pirellulales bacterium]